LVECGGARFFLGFALGPLGAEARHDRVADRVDAGLFFRCSDRAALAGRRCGGPSLGRIVFFDELSHLSVNATNQDPQQRADHPTLKLRRFILTAVQVTSTFAACGPERPPPKTRLSGI
jgi:hypothetical protein